MTLSALADRRALCDRPTKRIAWRDGGKPPLNTSSRAGNVRASPRIGKPLSRTRRSDKPDSEAGGCRRLPRESSPQQQSPQLQLKMLVLPDDELIALAGFFLQAPSIENAYAAAAIADQACHL